MSKRKRNPLVAFYANGEWHPGEDYDRLPDDTLIEARRAFTVVEMVIDEFTGEGYVVGDDYYLGEQGPYDSEILNEFIEKEEASL